jgi:hypothetical protein
MVKSLYGYYMGYMCSWYDGFIGHWVVPQLRFYKILDNFVPSNSFPHPSSSSIEDFWNGSISGNG